MLEFRRRFSCWSLSRLRAPIVIEAIGVKSGDAVVLTVKSDVAVSDMPRVSRVVNQWARDAGVRCLLVSETVATVVVEPTSPAR
jgi:hypothetical protein